MSMWQLNDRAGDSLGRNGNVQYQLDHRNPRGAHRANDTVRFFHQARGKPC